MKTLTKLLENINKEQSSSRRKDAAKKACEYILQYLQNNNTTQEQQKELKVLAESLVFYCERYQKYKYVPFFDNNFGSKLQSSKLITNYKSTHNLASLTEKELFFQIDSPNTYDASTSNVVGLESIQKILNDSIKLVIDHPELFTGYRKPAKVILLYGPPGTGKTHVVNTLRKYNLNMIKVTASDIFSKYQGDSEKLIKKLFEDALKVKPCVIFIDEIDFICKDRDEGSNETSNRIKSELLVRISQIENEENVFFLGATNFPWVLDSAFLRRFQKKIYIGLPDKKMRINLFKNFLSMNKVCLNDEDYQEMASKTDSFSSSDIKQVAERMLCSVIEELLAKNCFYKKLDRWVVCDICDSGSVCENSEKNKVNSFEQIKGEIEEPEVRISHFYGIIKKCKSSVKKETLSKYNEWTEQYGEK